MKRIYPLLLLGLAGLACLVAPLAAKGSGKPELRVTTLDGASFDLAAQRGKWVIVNYWATWCRPCIHEMPALSGFVKSRPDVTAIGLAYQDGAASAIKAFLARHPVSYPVARVDTAHPPAAFGAPLGLPTTYLIAPDGRVAKRFVGPVTPSDLEAVIGHRK